MSPTEQSSSVSKQMAELIVLTLKEATEVSGGGSNVRHNNPGGEPASYNIHTTPAGGTPAWYNLT
jgi:hypothetical protein